MLPKIKETVRFADVTAANLEGILLKENGTFPSIATAENISVDALPELAPRSTRRSVFGIPDKSTMLYTAGDKLSIFYNDHESGAACVMVPSASGKAVFPLSLEHRIGSSPSAAVFGGTLYFPQMRAAVDVVNGRRFYFDDAVVAETAAYSSGMGSEVVLTLTFAEAQGSFAVGDYVTLHTHNGYKTGEYFLPIDAVEENGKVIRFRGKYLPKEVEYSSYSTFTVSRSVPVCSSFVSCGNRLWGFDGKRTFYASVIGNPLCFSTGKAMPTGEGGGAFIAQLDAPILAMVSFKGKPTLLTTGAVAQIEGRNVAHLRLNACKKYGLTKGAEGTAAAVGNGLYFCSSEGLCRYFGTDTELLFAIEDDTSGALAAAMGTKYILRTKEHLYIYDTDKKSLVTETREGGLPSALVGGSFGVYELQENADGSSFITCILGELPKNEGQDFYSSIDYRSEYEEAVCSRIDFHPYYIKGRRTAARALTLDAEVKEGAELVLSARYDNGEKCFIGRLTGPIPRTLKKFALPTRPFERLYVEIEGHGGYRIFSVGIQKREHTDR